MGGSSGTPDSTVEPPGGVVGLIQRNTDKERWLLDNHSEMLTNASLLLSIGMMVVVHHCYNT